VIRSFVFLQVVSPHRIRSSHIARFSSGICSTVVEGAIPADNAGGTVGSNCGGGIGSKGRRGGELGRIALSCQGIVIGVRVEEEGRSPRLSACKVVAGRGGVELIEDSACCCVLGDIGLGIVADEDDGCGSFGLTLVRYNRAHVS
jgi:hypothetical protein